jgi:hypothetical protein
MKRDKRVLECPKQDQGIVPDVKLDSLGGEEQHGTVSGNADGKGMSERKSAAITREKPGGSIPPGSTNERADHRYRSARREWPQRAS